MEPVAGLLASAAGFRHALDPLVGLIGGVQRPVGGSLGGTRLAAGGLGGCCCIAAGISGTGYLIFQGSDTILEGIECFLGYASGEQKYGREGEDYVFHLWVSLWCLTGHANPTIDAENLKAQFHPKRR